MPRQTRAIATLALTIGLCLAGAGSAAAEPPGPTPRLLLNGGEPISKTHQGNVFAYADCPAGARPGQLSGVELGMPGSWYQISGQGYWAKVAVINAARPGPHRTSVTCSDGTVLSTAYVLEP